MSSDSYADFSVIEFVVPMSRTPRDMGHPTSLIKAADLGRSGTCNLIDSVHEHDREGHGFSRAEKAETMRALAREVARQECCWPSAAKAGVN
jgi:hypothetical protein